MSQVLPKKKVNIKPLKDLVLRLEKDHVLRKVLLIESDKMAVEELVMKIILWLRLV